MAHYEKKILNALLDSYENSLLSRGENKVNIQIAFPFTKKSMPAYFNESSMEFEDIHACVRELEQKDFLIIVWKKGKENHIVQKVLLNKERIVDVYQYLQRVPKLKMEDEILQLLTELGQVHTTPIVSAFITYLTARVSEGKSVKEFVELSDLKQAENLIRAVALIEQNDSECYIREFSIRHFGDSKIFETMLGKIGKVLRRFQDSFQDMEIYLILAEYSIYHTPNYVYLKGQGMILIGQELINLEHLRQGIGISGADLKSVQMIQNPNIKRVITIENLTTFFSWSEENSLIIYLGGYHNSIRRQLLNMIYEQMPTVEYLHFGDIDVGGFEIYEDLCVKTGITFHLYHMGITELQRYKKYTKNLTENDRKRLDAMIENRKRENCDYLEVLEYMKLCDLKLEQECIVMDGNKQ